MSNANTHIIKRQVLDIHTAVTTHSHQLQNDMRSFYYEKLLPLIEEACNQFDSGEVIRIDRLVIDLGEVSSKKMDDVFIRKFESKLQEQLSKALHVETQENVGVSGPTVKRIAQSTSDLELIASFLKTGILPWWKKEISLINLEAIFLEQLKKRPDEVKRFIASNSSNDIFLMRLQNQFSEKIMADILALFQSGKPDAERQFSIKLVQFFRQTIKDAGVHGAVGNRIEVTMIRFVIEHAGKLPQEKDLFEYLMTAVKGTAGISREDFSRTFFNATLFPSSKIKKEYDESFLARLKEILSASGFDSGLGKAYNQLLKKSSGAVEKTNAKEKNLTEKPAKKIKPIEKESLDISSASEEKKADKFSKQVNAEKIEEVYVQNAGLVLLWNYLPFYFKHVGLLTEGNFINDEARQRAAHLLQYVASGQSATPEFEMPLNKILCGIPLTETLEAGIDLTEKEKTETENMLQTVLDHWGALGKASSLALRQSFLCRAGMLVNEDNSWMLRVEESGIDILLNKIPWSYSIINFKWMEKPIYVSWR